MAIDNPMHAIERLNESDERARPGFARYLKPILQVLKALAPELFSKLTFEGLSTLNDYIEKRASANMSELVAIIIKELTYRGEQISRLEQNSEEHTKFMEEEFPLLVLDALRKAETARSRRRVERLGLVLIHAAEQGAGQSGDYVEEMLVAALALGEEDVQVLEVIDRIQRPMLRAEFGRVRHYDAYSVGKKMAAAFRTSGLNLGRVDSICSRLEGQGLVVRTERNTNVIADDPTPFALLKKGSDFLDYVKSHAPREAQPQQD